MMHERFYVKHPDQWPDVEEFSLMMLELSDVTFFQPSPVAAPWHWQAIVSGVTFNFWPHRNKWNIESQKPKYGWRSAKEEIIRTLEEGDIRDQLIGDDDVDPI